MLEGPRPAVGADHGSLMSALRAVPGSGVGLADGSTVAENHGLGPLIVVRIGSGCRPLVRTNGCAVGIVPLVLAAICVTIFGHVALPRLDHLTPRIGNDMFSIGLVAVLRRAVAMR